MWKNFLARLKHVDNVSLQLHEREEMYSMWGPDAPSVPPQTALFQLGIAASVFLGIAFIAHVLTPERVSIPREYPFSGLVKELGGLEENKVRCSHRQRTNYTLTQL